MKLIDLAQGSKEWHDHRASHFNASESAAMLGLSNYLSRNELLKQKVTGLSPEVNGQTQYLFDRGHQAESRAITISEAIIGSELFPVVCAKGNLSASCDGLSLDGKIAWEHKLFNQNLASSINRLEVPDMHMPQLQQVLMITGADKLLFVCSDGTKDNFAHMYVMPSQEWFDRITAGWEQFGKDIENYTPNEINEKPKADAIMKLPSLIVHIKGEVSLTNLPAFSEQANKYLSEINMDLQTDQDFANAEEQAKECREMAKTLELTKKTALSQTASIDDLLRTVDHLKAQFNQVGLSLEKLVATQKEAIKLQILAVSRAAFNGHLLELEKEISPINLNCKQPDFAGAMKNKRTLVSLHDACDAELANAKIDADAIARGVREKLKWYEKEALGHEFLFVDLQSIIYQPEFMAAVSGRIEKYKLAEEAKRLELAEEAKMAVQEAEYKRLDAEKEEAVNNVVWPEVQEKAAKIKEATKELKPTFNEIVTVLATHYDVDEPKIRAWFRSYNIPNF